MNKEDYYRSHASKQKCTYKIQNNPYTFLFSHIFSVTARIMMRLVDISIFSSFRILIKIDVRIHNPNTMKKEIINLNEFYGGKNYFMTFSAVGLCIAIRYTRS